MTETERSLLDAVLENPDDDLPRLVYADWLDENGDQMRAEFIRAQIVLAKSLSTEAYDSDDYVSATKSTMSYSLSDYQDLFLKSGISLSPRELYFSGTNGDSVRIRDAQYSICLCLHRGFLQEIDGNLDWIIANYHFLFTHPINRLTIEMNMAIATIDIKKWGNETENAWQLVIGYPHKYDFVNSDCRFNSWKDVSTIGHLFIGNALGNHDK